MIDNEKRMRSAIHQLQEHAGLTDALTDSDAKTLLAWGEQQLRDSLRNPEMTLEINDIARQVRRVMRAMNNLIGQKSELSDRQILERLLYLVSQAMQLANQKTVTDSGPRFNQSRATNNAD